MRAALGWVLDMMGTDAHGQHAQKSLDIAAAATARVGVAFTPLPVPAMMRDVGEIEVMRAAMKTMTAQAVRAGREEERSTAMLVGMEAGARWAAGLPAEDNADEAIDAHIRMTIRVAASVETEAAREAAAVAGAKTEKGGEGPDDW
jgi:hypothetical protein